MDEAHEHMLEFGKCLSEDIRHFFHLHNVEVRCRFPSHTFHLFVPLCFCVCFSDVTTRPKGEKIPHEQQMKFFGKVQCSFSVSFCTYSIIPFFTPP